MHTVHVNLVSSCACQFGFGHTHRFVSFDTRYLQHLRAQGGMSIAFRALGPHLAKHTLLRKARLTRLRPVLQTCRMVSSSATAAPVAVSKVVSSSLHSRRAYLHIAGCATAYGQGLQLTIIPLIRITRTCATSCAKSARLVALADFYSGTRRS